VIIGPTQVRESRNHSTETSKQDYHTMTLAPSQGQRRTISGLSSKPAAFDPKLRIFIVMCLTAVFWILTDYQPTFDLSYLNTATLTALTMPGSFSAVQNAEEMAAWRTSTEAACQEVIDSAKGNLGTPDVKAKKENLERDAMQKFVLPSSSSFVSSDLPANHQTYQYCRNVFLDLGTNIGDSIGYFVDNALDVCTPKWPNQKRIDKDFPRPHLDVTKLKMLHKGFGANPLYKLLQAEMNKEDSVSPESFCVYGMEGNPEFTPRLQKLENYVMDMKPRPVQHLHIHTESVVTAVDGPNKLFLDKTSVAENVSKTTYIEWIEGSPLTRLFRSDSLSLLLATL
jgi:hypothetical protein